MRVKLFEEDEYLLEWLTKYLQYKGYEIFGFSEDYTNNQNLSDKCHCTKKDVCADVLLVGVRTLTRERIQSLINQEVQGCLLPRSRKGILSETSCPEIVQLAQEQGFTVIKKPFKLEEISNWLENCRHHS